jgi:hypothetical protein
VWAEQLVHDGWAYVSNTGQALLLRYPLTSAALAADLEVTARHLVGDDLTSPPAYSSAAVRVRLG